MMQSVEGKKVWFITGVSSGLGRTLALEAAKSGALVIGTARKAAQAEEFSALVEGKTFGKVLDVNDHGRVKAVMQEVVDEYGRVDVLVNNAGYGLVGALEETSMEESRAQMETNFFGALAVTQAVLPSMRAAGRGHIFQISSIAGMVGAPGLSLYDASKHALEGVSEALAAEVNPLGIHVTIVEPGPFRTKWAGANMVQAKEQMECYAATAGTMRENLAKLDGNQPGDPVRAAQLLISISEHEKPPLRLPLGAKAVAAISGKLDRVRDEIDAFRTQCLGADFPE